MLEAAIETLGLTKVFNGTAAVDNIELSVPKGSVFGFLGPNGAGKTTTQRMLVGLAKPTSGTARILGYDVVNDIREVRKRIGFLPDVPAFYPWMNGPEYLMFVADVFGIKAGKGRNKTDAALERAGLKGVKTKIGGYSRGMKQRLGIAQALINDPEVILMDEPTSALDPIGRKEVLETIEALGREITVFFSTHILNDVERVCDNVAILNKGRVLADQSLDSLKGKYAAKPAFNLELEETQKTLMEEIKRQLWAAGVEETEPRSLKITVSDLDTGRRALLKMLSEEDISFRSLSVVEPTLEEIFMTMVEEA
ncbi:MAG: ABC transporter ATP-binding protein [Actinomycetota bacterium]